MNFRIKELTSITVVFLVIIPSLVTPYSYSNQVSPIINVYESKHAKAIKLSDLINTTLPILFVYPYIDQELIAVLTLYFISLGERFDIDKVLGEELSTWTKAIDHDKAYVLEYEKAVFIWTAHGFYYYEYLDNDSLPSKSFYSLLGKNLTRLAELLTYFFQNKYLDEKVTYNGSSNGYDVFYVYFGRYRLAYPLMIKGIDTSKVDTRTFSDKIKVQAIIGYLPYIVNRENLVFNMSIFNQIKDLVSKTIGGKVDELYVYDTYLLPFTSNPYVIAPTLKIGVPGENITVRIQITDKNITIYNVTEKPPNTTDLFQIPYDFTKILEEHTKETFNTIITIALVFIAIICSIALIVFKIIRRRS